MRWVLGALVVVLGACSVGSEGAVVDPADVELLLPFADDLGPGWSSLDAEEIDEMVLFDPAEEPDASCGISEPLVVHDAVVGEYGYGESPDDAFVVISRGTAGQNQAVFDVLLALSQCEAQGALEVVDREAPELAIAADVARFAVDDQFDQHTENVVVLAEGFVYFLGIADMTDRGAEPTDLDALVVELFDRLVAEA